MSVETAPMFSCGSCGKQFKWKAAIAGKSAKCACGAKVDVPAAPTASPEREENVFEGFDDIMPAAPAPALAYAPAPVRSAPKPAGKAKSPAGVAVGAGGPGKKAVGARAAGGAKSKDPRYYSRTSVGPTQQEIEESRNQAFWGRPKDKVVPLIMIGLSASVTFGLAAYTSGSGMLIGVLMVYSLVCVAGLVLAAFLSAAVGGLSFGIMGIAILRLAAISYACLAVDAIILLGGQWWLIFVRWVITFAIFTFGLIGFFDFEYDETRLVAATSTFINWLFRWGLMAAIGALGHSGGRAGSAADDDLDNDIEPPAIVKKDAKRNVGRAPATQGSADKDDDDDK